MAKPRRRSNSFSLAAGHSALKTKFETVEPEPVFEEEIHGPSAADFGTPDMADSGYDLEKASTGSSSGMGSIDEEDMHMEKK